jgi:uncharacterized protein (TIGR03085 family)
MSSVARAERHQLCDLALELGPSAPTLCGDWDVKELLAHLVVRERSPLGAPGILVPRLEHLTDRAMHKAARRDLATLVRQLRAARSLLAVPVVDQLVNTLEFFVHHEDIRRAQHGWTPRALDDRTNDVLWRAITVGGRALVRPAGVPVSIRRADSRDTSVLRRGSDPVVVTGPVGELVMFLYGRRQTAGLEFAGPETSVRRLRNASLGL